MSNTLRLAGIMNPLECKHHLKSNEWFHYREGVVIKRPIKDRKGSWINIGLTKDCQVNMALQEGTRVTVKLNENGFKQDIKFYTGEIVSS
mmetsp:Transcript_42895/g.31330  ORF Transcript_42895/g.31330 Transcript_42895/m.31330 type:complete len:90 (-) Transcript_42895:289-558(-)